MITCVAIKTLSGVYALPEPNRHHNVIKTMHDNGESAKSGIQGFVTDTGAFLNREQARSYALAIGQVSEKKLNHQRELFSEDLW